MTKCTLLRRLSAAALLVCTGTAMAQPANDTCATATVIGSMPFSDAQSVAASTATDTTAPQPSCDSSSATAGRFDIWYKWVAPANGFLTVNSVDAIDTATQVWTNSTNDCLGTWTAVGCSDPETSSYAVVSGNTYFIQMAYWFSTGTPTGNYSTSFDFVLPPANDACASANVLTVGTPFTGSTVGSTNDGPTNTSTTNGCTSTYFATTNLTVWHTFTTGAAGIYTISTCTATGFDNKLGIYAGTACSGSVAALACNDSSCGTLASVAANLTAATTYTIRLSGSTTGTGPYTILVTGPQGGTAPSNDDGLTPEVLAANTPTAGDLTAATGSTTTLATCGSSTTTGKDVWYTYTPTLSGSHTVTVCGQFDTILSTHTSPTTASSVCNDDTIPAGCTLHGSQLTFTGVAGTPQLIRVAAVGPGTLLPEHGTFTITVIPPVSGACCFAGNCTITASSSCTGENVFQGANTTCTPNPCPAPIAGDFCASPLTAVVGANPGTNLGATTEPGSTLAAGCASNSGTKDVFFAFTAPNTTTYTFSLCGSTTTDTIMALHNAGTCPTTAATSIACADDGCTTGNSLVSYIANVSLTAGQNILIRIANWSSSAAGAPFVLTISSEPFGACCTTATGACVLQFQGACLSGGGTTFNGGGTCSPNPCPQPDVRCCAPDGSCTLSQAAACVSPNVAGAAGSTCTPNTCPTPPANDNCSTPTTVMVGSPAATGNNSTATNGTGETHACQASSAKGVWFDFTAPAAGNFRFDTEGSAQSDTVLSVFDACGGTSIGCDDDSGTGFLSSLTLTLTNGQNVKVLVSSFGASPAGGGYNLNITQIITGACCVGPTCSIVTGGSSACTGTYQGDNSTCSPNPCGGACCNNTTGVCTSTVDAAECTTAGGTFQGLGSVCSPSPCPAPANDLCSSAQALSLGVSFSGQNVTAATALDGPAATCQSSSSKSVWFTYVASATAAHKISTCGSNQDTVLQVYSLTDCNDTMTWTAVACDDDTCDGVTPPGSGLAAEIGSVVLTAGQTYYIRLSSFGTAAAGGLYNITVSLVGTTGSCCISTACSVTDSANCTGTYTDGGTCSPNPCLPPTGRCCVGGRCEIVVPASCVASGAAGASFTAGASDCNATGIFNTPCCFADYNKAGGVSVQDIFDFLSDWFNNSVNANIGGDGVAAPGVQDIFDFLTAWFGGGC